MLVPEEEEDEEEENNVDFLKSQYSISRVESIEENLALRAEIPVLEARLRLYEGILNDNDKIREYSHSKRIREG